MSPNEDLEFVPDPVRLAIRGFAGRTLQFDERVDVPLHRMGTLLETLATKHATALAAHELHMIEIEFLDEPNQNERFFRFGTDPRGMVMPIKVQL